jgi:pimeloyl-ACP methyl ester carboxylesterase
VLHGALDRLVPVAVVEDAAASHPNWKLKVFPDLGHVPQLEAPDRWLRAVDAWLDGAESEGRERAS